VADVFLKRERGTDVTDYFIVSEKKLNKGRAFKSWLMGIRAKKKKG